MRIFEQVEDWTKTQSITRWTSTGFPSEQQLSKSKPTLKPIPSCSPTASTFRNKPVPHTKRTHVQCIIDAVYGVANVYTISHYLVSESVNIWYVLICIDSTRIACFQRPAWLHGICWQHKPICISIYLYNSCGWKYLWGYYVFWSKTLAPTSLSESIWIESINN